MRSCKIISTVRFGSVRFVFSFSLLFFSIIFCHLTFTCNNRSRCMTSHNVGISNDNVSVLRSKWLVCDVRQTLVKMKLKFSLKVLSWHKRLIKNNFELVSWDTLSSSCCESDTYWMAVMPCLSMPIIIVIFSHCLFQQNVCFCFYFVVAILWAVNNGREQAPKRFMSIVEYRFAN